MIKNIERFTNHFLLQNVLILGFFSFYKKAATSYLWGFFLSTSRSTKVKNICFAHC